MNLQNDKKTRKNPQGKVLSVYIKQEGALHMMLLFPVLFTFVYRYIPMAGIVLAFKTYKARFGIFGSPWAGLENFRILFSMPGFLDSIRNTIVISVLKIVIGIAVPVIFALMLNEVNKLRLKKIIQTIVYMPYFISWVLMAGIIIKMMAQYGVINQVLGYFGIEPIIFLADKEKFPYIVVISDVWKGFGYTSIVYLAAITGIDPNLYEAAEIDGAGRWRQTLHITLPGMIPVIILMAALALGRILDAGFDQIFNLYSPVVYKTGDILDTFIYRMAFQNSQFSISTAAGLFKSLVGCILIVISYRFAYKISGYQIF
ncbi:MAG: ABC transporter permease subunit [Spirochaetaceae bacterium]|nr:ABC transporter permease subunit [Spirochaetaceae bacterium]